MDMDAEPERVCDAPPGPPVKEEGDARERSSVVVVDQCVLVLGEGRIEMGCVDAIVCVRRGVFIRGGEGGRRL